MEKTLSIREFMQSPEGQKVFCDAVTRTLEIMKHTKKQQKINHDRARKYFGEPNDNHCNY